MTGFTTLRLLECLGLLLALAATCGLWWRRRRMPRDGAQLQDLNAVALAPREERLHADALRLAYQRAIFEADAAGLLVIDSQGQIADLNPALCDIFGYQRSELLGQGAAILHRGERPFKPFRASADAIADGRGAGQSDHRFSRKDGSRLWCQILGAPIVLPTGDRGVVWSLIDVSARYLAQERAHFLALHDELTGLPNRRALEQQLPKAIARARRRNSVLALGVIDLDDFKPVNDTWGHEAGDRLLIEVARRMRVRLRESDLIVRSGGDEFVVLLEELETGSAMDQLQELLTRLHGAVETAFELGPGQSAKVGASIGLALYPLDAQDADSLQRLADAAMYQSKLHKHARGQWWHRGAEPLSAPEPEQPFDAYGEEASALLAKAADGFDLVAQQFVEQFWSQFANRPPARAVLAGLSEAEVTRLADAQLRHLQFVLDPGVGQAQILARAEHLGSVHALVGIGSEVMVQALALHRRLLGDHLNGALLPARERYRTLLGAETRLQESMQAELRSLADVVSAYLGHLSTPLPPQGSLWPDARAAEIDALGRLPGLLAALVMRLNAEGVFNVDGGSGPRSQEIARVLQTPGTEAVVHPDSTRGQGASAQAWRKLEIQSSAHYERDPRYVFWRDQARAMGLRSTLSIPVPNPQGQPVAMVSLFGAYPNQFESSTMQQFARGLQQRWQQIWQRCSTPAMVLPLDVAQDYRHSLFAGGLRMHMQPVIDLRSGALVKVEGLARLERPDGSLLSPAEFLPLLGDAELDRLFRLGLDIMLEQLRLWDDAGLKIDGALNISAGTLLDPDCPRWIAEALRRHGVAPQRLGLELLETETKDASAQQAAIRGLQQLGVKLSMDDLGTGYSNLERWVDLPFDFIKLDQVLLGRVKENPVLILSMIRTFVQMGCDNERGVVVEGLEFPASIEAASILGAPYGQGYGLARPMPARDIVGWSRQFRLGVRSDEVQSPLGALAQVWSCAAPEGRPDSGHRHQECPLGGFLAREGGGNRQLAQWHRDLHAGRNGALAIRQLQGWLAGQIRATDG